MRLPRRGATAAVAVSAVLLTGCTGNSSGVQIAAVGRSTVSEVVEAPAAYVRALELSPSEAERRFIERRLEELRG